MNVVIANENKSIIDRLDIDVIKRIDGQYELSDLLSKFTNLYYNKMVMDITAINGYNDLSIIDKLKSSVEPSRVILLLNDNPVVNNPVFISNLVKAGFYNFTRNLEGIKYLYNTPNTYDNVSKLVLNDQDTIAATNNLNSQIENNMNAYIDKPAEDFLTKSRIVIGIENLTEHAGASTITNMLVRQINAHGYQAYGIEMFKQDLMFYRDPSLSACFTAADLDRKLKDYVDASAVIIDLNNFGEAEKYCDEILYLVEPSYIKMTKLLRKNKNAFAERKDDKIVLNKSFVNDKEVADFQYETKTRVFKNIPPLNDRNKDIEEINELLRLFKFKV